MIKGYSFISLIYISFCFLFSKVFFSGARIIRLPIFLRNKKNIFFGKGFTSGVCCRFDVIKLPGKEPKITFGFNVQVNDYVHIAAIENVNIGNNVLIASKVFISDHNHGSYSGVIQSSPLEAPSQRALVSKPVVICDNVWIGEFVSVLPGVRIGKGSIIGANSVVTSDVPENSIAVGIPAKVIKKFDFESSRWVNV